MKKKYSLLTKRNLTGVNDFKVEFLIDCNSESECIENLKLNHLASVRLRTAVSAVAAKKLNFTVLCSDGLNDTTSNILVVGKITNITDVNRPSRWLNKISKLKSLNTKIVIDYTDHHIDENSDRGDFYRKSIKFADAVVCSSVFLKKELKRYFDGPIYIIEEPIEVPIIPPVEKNNDTKNILWFGHESNLPYLFNCLLNIFDDNIHARLILMTNVVPFPKEYCELLSIKKLENIDINVVPWSSEDLIKAASMCDFCILPTGYMNTKKAGASSNRLVTSLALGLPVLSDNLHSYQKFSEYFEILNTSNLIKYTNTLNYDFQNIKKSQKLIASNFSKEFIISAWQKFFNDLKTNNNSININKPSLVKLNLGCGDKILDGYINIDVVDARAGKKPDFICDLHDLSKFESNSVDEIMAIHVVEHFWQWEVVDILKEWARVLKPGGKMILECPNLITAAEEFIKNSDEAALGGLEGQRSMWVFYGDPGWRDPLMIHRWGYTPRSLATVMSTAGLIELKQEPAQFKLREPRDMRISGVKKN
jgi:hypothetical protein